MLSDKNIRLAHNATWISITPFIGEQINPASYDLLLDRDLLVPNLVDFPVLDVAEIKPGHMRQEYIDEKDGYLLAPDAFILGSTYESIYLSSSIAARVEGKSSLARIGLSIHQTGGFIDPGFQGTITLEIKNVSNRSIRIRAGMRIAQIAFQRVDGEVLRGYSETGRYDRQFGVTESRYKMDGGSWRE